MARRAARALVGLVIVSLVAACVDVTVVPPASPGASVVPSATQSIPPSQPPASSPSVRVSPPPTSSAPGSQSPGAPATISPDLSAQIDSVTSAMPAIRQLSATRDVPYEFITRDQFSQDLVALNNQETPPDVQAALGRLLKRLGLLPPEADLEALLVQLYTGQVAAYYRPDTQTFYIIKRSQPFGPADEVTVAHEYTHALQDMHFDLESSRIADPSEGDAALAQLAVIEGDATLASQIWMLQNLTLDQMLQMLNESLGEVDMQQLASMPPILRRELEFPYTDGLTFVSNLYCGQPSCMGSGNWQPVDDALVTPPASTEQILHPAKYGVDEPVRIDLPDMSSQLGAGWSRTMTQTLGELDIQVLMAGDEAPTETLPGLPVEWPHSEAAAGWGGDRLAMYEGPNDAWLIDWQTAWDTPADANEFSTRVMALGPSFEGQLLVAPGTAPNGIHVVLANDATTMNLVAPPR